MAPVNIINLEDYRSKDLNPAKPENEGIEAGASVHSIVQGQIKKYIKDLRTNVLDAENENNSQALELLREAVIYIYSIRGKDLFDIVIPSLDKAFTVASPVLKLFLNQCLAIALARTYSVDFIKKVLAAKDQSDQLKLINGIEKNWKQDISANTIDADNSEYLNTQISALENERKELIRVKLSSNQNVREKDNVVQFPNRRRVE